MVLSDFHLQFCRTSVRSAAEVQNCLQHTAAHGHFGIESRPWEQTDLADKLRELAGI